jgi:hypothetical protein
MNHDQRRCCIQKAKELGPAYERSLVGCGHCSFAAVADSLKSQGIRLAAEEVEEKIFSGLIGLTGGFGNMGIGSCGALSGAAFAISLATGVTKEENAQDKTSRWLAYRDVKKYIGDKFLERWGALTCREIQIRNFGIALNSRIPERNKELFKIASEKGCGTPEQCTIALAAGWATEGILEILNRTPDERERIKQELTSERFSNKFWV